jgi:hypothetical protein
MRVMSTLSYTFFLLKLKIYLNLVVCFIWIWKLLKRGLLVRAENDFFLG